MLERNIMILWCVKTWHPSTDKDMLIHPRLTGVCRRWGGGVQVPTAESPKHPSQRTTAATVSSSSAAISAVAISRVLMPNAVNQHMKFQRA